MSLRRRQCVGWVDAVEQIAEHRERERSLRFRRSSRKNPGARRSSPVDALLPERGLADACVADEREARWTRSSAIEDVGDRL
jgi:hypothetical protein